jgi:hypothetical protein
MGSASNKEMNPASAGGGKMIFDFGNGTLAFDGHHKSGARLHLLHPDNLSFAQQSNGMA